MKKVNYTTTKIALNDYEGKTLQEAFDIIGTIYNQAPEDTKLENMSRDAFNSLRILIDESIPNDELDTEMCWTAEEYNETEEQARVYSFSFRLHQSKERIDKQCDQ